MDILDNIPIILHIPININESELLYINSIFETMKYFNLNSSNITENFDNDIMNNLKKIFINDTIVSNIIQDKKQDLIIEINDVYYQMTSSYNQNNNENNNISSIKLGECEDILKKKML